MCGLESPCPTKVSRVSLRSCIVRYTMSRQAMREALPIPRRWDNLIYYSPWLPLDIRLKRLVIMIGSDALTSWLDT